MTTTVVNLKHAPFDVYIGRAGHGQDGYFGNPVKVGEACPVCGLLHPYPGSTIPCFKTYFLDRVARDPTFRRRVLELRGKRLGCFCLPMACHGTVIATWIDAQAVEEV